MYCCVVSIYNAAMRWVEDCLHVCVHVCACVFEVSSVRLSGLRVLGTFTEELQLVCVQRNRYRCWKS